jgi:hypothetical protein
MAKIDPSLYISINCPDCSEGTLMFKMVEDGYGILGKCDYCSVEYFGGFHMMRKERDKNDDSVVSA